MQNLALGIPKTFQQTCSEAGIPIEEALAIFQLWNNPEVKAAIVLQAFSIPITLIEEVFNVTQKDLQQVAKFPEASALITKWSLKLKQYEGKNAHARLLPLALMAQEQILTASSTDSRTRLNVASEIIDRVKGKPKQSLEVSSSSLIISADLTENDKRIQAGLDRVRELTESRQKLIDAQENANA